MTSASLINQPWVIAAVTFVATIVAVPLAITLAKRITSLFGPYSGQYVALTELDSSTFLVEYVRCRHVGSRISGRIREITVLVPNPNSPNKGEFEEIEESRGSYAFTGSVDERLFVVSYRTTSRRVHSAGLIVLQGNSSGDLFSGTWAGIEEETGELDSGDCKWMRLPKSVSPVRHREQFVALATDWIANFENSKRTQTPPES